MPPVGSVAESLHIAKLNSASLKLVLGLHLPAEPALSRLRVIQRS